MKLLTIVIISAVLGAFLYFCIAIAYSAEFALSAWGIPLCGGFCVGIVLAGWNKKWYPLVITPICVFIGYYILALVV